MSDLRLIVPDVGELVFTLTGEPGRRVVRVARHDGVPYGRLTYAELMSPDCSEMFAPHGDVMRAREGDLALIGTAGLNELRYWAEQQALGVAATGEEAYD